MLTVGAIVKEPPATLRRFIEWHLNRGADRIALCFDDPKDPAIDLAREWAEVEAIPCDAAFWEGIGVDPEARFPLRQNAAIHALYDRAPPGWFLNIDGDELVHLDGRDLAEELSRQPDEVMKLGFLPAEPVQTPFDAETLHARLPSARPWALRKLYGDLSIAVAKRGGLMGHIFGKLAFRTGLALSSIRQHDALDAAGAALPGPHLGPDDGAWLLHFVDQGYASWRSKVEWRLHSRGFTHRLGLAIEEAMRADDPEAALRAIYDRLFVFDAERIETLRRGRAHKSWPRADLGL